MKKIITLKISQGNHGQLLTLAAELRIMARSWQKFGVKMDVQAGKLAEQKSTHKSNFRKW